MSNNHIVYHTFIPKYAMVRSHGMSGSGKVMADSDAESKHDGYVNPNMGHLHEF